MTLESTSFSRESAAAKDTRKCLQLLNRSTRILVNGTFHACASEREDVWSRLSAVPDRSGSQCYDCSGGIESPVGPRTLACGPPGYTHLRTVPNRSYSELLSRLLCPRRSTP